MTTAVETVRTVLAGNPSVVTDLGTRINPLQAIQNQVYPYSVVSVPLTEPLTCFSGYAGLDHLEVQIDVWAKTFTDADRIARECRSSMEAAGYACLRGSPGNFDSQMDPGSYSVGFVFDVWQPE